MNHGRHQSSGVIPLQLDFIVTCCKQNYKHLHRQQNATNSQLVSVKNPKLSAMSTTAINTVFPKLTQEESPSSAQIKPCPKSKSYVLQ